MDRTLVPNSTPFPDVLTDQIMPLVSGNEWKVIHYGVRYALGHRSADTLAIAQLAHGRQAEDGSWIDRGTGIDETEVKDCLDFLCDQAHIFLREDRPRKPHGYRLNLDLASINWDVLEKRRGEQLLVQPAETAPAADQPAAPQRTRRAPAAFVELPLTDVRLDGAGGPLLDVFRQALSGDEWKTFDYLAALAAQKSRLEQEDIVWPLYKLWRTYGFRRLQNAFQAPMPVTSLDDLNHSCLVGAVTEILEAEKFGQITPSFREQIVDLTREWPNLSDWQEAIRSAVLYNSRRVSTVEKNLKRGPGQPAKQPDGDNPNAATSAPARGRKRPTRRQSEWSNDELSAGRAADSDKEWPTPLE